MTRHRIDLPGVAAACALCALPAAALAQTGFDFAPPVVYPIGQSLYPHSIDAGDINEDDRIDLVMAARNNEGLLPIFFQQADGTFGPPVLLEVDGQTNWALLRDVNGDSHLDLILTHRSGLGRISVRHGDGTGAFGDPVFTFVGRAPTPLVCEDFDRDGDDDLVTLNWTSYDLSVIHDFGGGQYVPVQHVRMNRSASPSPFGIAAAAADLDGDGDLDLAVAGVNTGRFITLFANRGDGTFDDAVQFIVPGVEPDEVAPTITSMDFDGDGDIDLVTKAGGADFVDRLIMLANDGAGGFTLAGEIPLTPLGGSPWEISVVDLDDDDRRDLAWVTHALSSRVVGLLRNIAEEGGPAFDTPEQTFFLDGFPRALIAVDLDADDDLDIAVANIGNHSLAVFEQGPGGLAAPDEGAPPRRRRASLRELADLGAPLGARQGGAPIRTGAGAGPCGDPDAGDCFEPHANPGCDDQACCEDVCKTDPFCCDVEWDQNCADTAIDTCEIPVCPGKGSCFERHAEPGCDDLACCELITLIDVFCGGVWDQLCVDQARAMCALGPCALEPCPEGAIVEPESIDCGASANDGCNGQEPLFTPVACGDAICGTTWTFLKRDTDWYEIVVDEPSVLTWTVSAEFPVEALIITGTCDTTYKVAAAAYGGTCSPTTAAIAAQPGTYYLFVGPGTEAAAIAHGIGCLDQKGKLVRGGAFASRYTASVSCQDACAADLDGDLVVSAGDLLILLAAWGQAGPDLDGDGVVAAGDLAALLAAWGPCV